MPIWDRFRRKTEAATEQSVKYAVIDAEVGIKDHKVHDIGALRYDGTSRNRCFAAGTSAS